MRAKRFSGIRCAAVHSLIGLAAISFLASGCSQQRQDQEEPVGIAVRTEVVHRRPHQSTLVLFGTVRPSETIPLVAIREGLISFPKRFAGGLRTGEVVAAGETIAFVENENARLALAEAKLRADFANEELERNRKGLAEGVVSKDTFGSVESNAHLAQERLLSAARDSGRLAIKAPSAGRLVLSRDYPAGSEIGSGSIVAELAATGRPRVEASAAAADRVRLHPGLSVRFTLPGVSEPAGTGKIREVASVVDPGGTIRVVADVDGAKDVPAPGEGIEMRVELESSPSALTVPEEALSLGSGGASVFTLESSGQSARFSKARRVGVEIAGRGGGRVEVRRGVDEGDRIVVSGAAFLTDGSLVIEAPVEAATAAAAAASGTPAGKK